MNIKLERKLIKKFPLCFGDVNKSLKESLMGFGCEHGNGWYQIIYDACEKAEPLIQKWLKENPNEDKGWMPRLSQVKEKYGTLRMYWSTYPEGFDKIERDAEKKSETTCEQCGKEGKLRGQGWYYTACYKHSKPEDRDNLEILEAKYDKKQKGKNNG